MVLEVWLWWRRRRRQWRQWRGGMKVGGGDTSNSFDGDRIEYLGGSGGIYNSLSNQSNSSGVRIGNGSVINSLVSVMPDYYCAVPVTNTKPTITASFPGSVNFIGSIQPMAQIFTI